MKIQISFKDQLKDTEEKIKFFKDQRQAILFNIKEENKRSLKK